MYNLEEVLAELTSEQYDLAVRAFKNPVTGDPSDETVYSRGKLNKIN